MKIRETIVAVAVLAIGLIAGVHAQGKYPERPITLVVPSAPGGSTDFTARLVSDGLAKALGQPVIVDNRPGASGNIGNQVVARSKPDGYTLLVSYSGYQVANPHLFKRAGWDPIKDFVPVAMLTRAPQIIVAREGLPSNNLQELIAYAKANPGKLNYASSGNGSIQHIAAEMLKQIASIDMIHVPYKGAGPVVQDLMGGNVDLFITTPASVMGQIQAGKLKGLAVTSSKRLAALPNVPTTNESGLKGYQLDSWFALYAPAGTPPDVVRKLNTEVNRILQMPNVRRKAEDQGTDVEIMSPAQLGEYTKSELDRWGKIISAAGITAD